MSSEETEVSEENRSGKRKDYIGWEEYFMGVAFVAALRSKDPRTQVGACVVNEDNIIVGVGYNGFPRDCSDDVFPWKKSNLFLNDKKAYVCHAEMNAILNSNTNSRKGCRIYVTLFPCNECAKIIIQSGIKEVIYAGEKTLEKDRGIASMKMFDAAEVKCRKFRPKTRKLVIDFDAML